MMSRAAIAPVSPLVIVDVSDVKYGVVTRRHPVTARQQKVLDFLRAHTAEHGYPPTIREIGRHMGIRSTTGVNDHLRALERKGLIRRSDGVSRGAVGIDPTPSAAAEVATLERCRIENDALRSLLGKVQSAATRLPRLTAEFVVLLGDIRDAVAASEGEDDHG